MGQIVSDITSVLDYQDAKKTAKNQRQEILAEMAKDNAEKQNLVKKVLATQRAKYGASGVSASSVTAGKVLERLKSETTAPYEEKRRKNQDKLKSSRATRPNLLKSLLSRLDGIID